MSLLDDLRSYAWRKITWDKLFQGDALFTELKALPISELPQAIQQIHTCQQTLPNRLPADLWQTANAVLTCAEIASLDRYTIPGLPALLAKIDPSAPAFEVDSDLDAQTWPAYLRQRLGQIAWPAQTGPSWGWDTVTCFWKKQRPAESSQRITLLLLDEREQGMTAELFLELLQDGRGTLYPDPETMSFVSLKDSFQESLREAVRLAQAQDVWPGERDIRWRIERQDGRPLTALDGGSAGGAYALGLLKLLVQA